MSKKKVKSANIKPRELGNPTNDAARPGRISKAFAYLWQRLWLTAVIALVSMGVLGSGLKYMEEDARRQNVLAPKDRSLLSAVNPFVTSPSPSPTPQLSKEYIYAGSRLLAVEDANANAAPPADLAVWRPSTGVWWVLGGPGSQQTSFQWGGGSDIPVPGDYDGDGKTDFAIFRPSNGQWWIFRSSDDTYYSFEFGTSGDVPVVADYDGDGKSDAALARANSSTNETYWYIFRSSDSNISTHQFGLDTDVPAPADYDGDGKADITVFRASNTTFYTFRSTDEVTQYLDIASTGTPVPADYDGNGKANYAIRTGSDWKIFTAFPNIVTGTGGPQSYESVSTVSFQQSGDIPVHNDYDGDGIVDIAVWRDSNGTWYIRQSSRLGQQDELRTQQWGSSGDIPVPAYYRR
ncbi:MAG TPA: VCBS repeat-containing protein [Pyrinomonadaceae bacterium]|nr:VCBS repeat-containing protein [Pyrinomonadaceae bacterium]HMP67003.1 VCBS repeat-containing protein [Pyrinomonadaceae bacterium]